MEQATSRCPLCKARGLAPTTRTLRLETGNTRAFADACSHCGLLLDGAILGDANAAFGALLARRPAMLGSGDPFGCDIYTLRTMATRFGLAAEPAGATQSADLAHPHGTHAAKAHLVPLFELEPTPISVGILCGRDEADAVVERAKQYRGWAETVFVLVDGADGTPFLPKQAGDGFVRVSCRPLARNFAAQRNVLQDLSGSRWMFQLDADEDVSFELGQAMTRLATLADRQGIVSIGLPRENYVDGRLSDLYPDIQYRLNRREVRYEGKVHERPVRSWQTSFIALSGAIQHHLTADRVARRSKGYETIAPGGGRLFEAQPLLRPYAPS